MCPANTGKDRHSVSTTTESNLFMFSPLAKYAGFYQQLLRGTADYCLLGNRLIQLAEQAHSLRQFDRVEEIGLVLSNIPIKHFETIGGYFLAVAANSLGNGDRDEAGRLFESAVDRAPDPYKVKAVLSLGALAFHNNDFDSAFYFYREAIKTEGIGSATLQAIRGIATLKSIAGYHRSAIADVETILPLIRFAPSNVHFDCLNSYAVELAEVGRLQEAKNVSSLVVASPLIRFYPEWQDTLREVNSRRKSRSTIAISLPQREPDKAEARELCSNVIQFPAVERALELRAAVELTEPDELSLTPVRLLALILKVMLEDRITDEEIERICALYYDTVTTWYPPDLPSGI